MDQRPRAHSKFHGLPICEFSIGIRSLQHHSQRLSNNTIVKMPCRWAIPPKRSHGTNLYLIHPFHALTLKADQNGLSSMFHIMGSLLAIAMSPMLQNPFGTFELVRLRDWRFSKIEFGPAYIFGLSQLQAKLPRGKKKRHPFSVGLFNQIKPTNFS